MKKRSGFFRFFLAWFLVSVCFYIVATFIFPVNEENELQISDLYMSAMAVVPIVCGTIFLIVTSNKNESRNKKKSYKPFLFIVCIIAIVFVSDVLKTSSVPILGSLFLSLAIVFCGMLLIISVMANKYMEEHRFDTISSNNLMNSSVDLENYFTYRDELVSYLSKMKKTEIFLKKENRFTEKPSTLLNEIKENENLHIRTAILRMADNCKKFTREQGVPFSGTFEKQIEKYADRLSQENMETASRCLLELKEYEIIAGKIEEVDYMGGHEFEYWCADLLEKSGFSNVQVTPGSGDQGVDILAEKDSIKYAVQCKCYSSDLGNTPVQEVHTGKAIYHCQIGVVMTNRHFTQGAKDAAEATGVLLWDRDKLQQMIEASHA